MLDNSAQRPATGGAARADLGIQLRLDQDRVARLHADAGGVLANGARHRRAGLICRLPRLADAAGAGRVGALRGSRNRRERGAVLPDRRR